MGAAAAGYGQALGAIAGVISETVSGFASGGSVDLFLPSPGGGAQPWYAALAECSLCARAGRLPFADGGAFILEVRAVDSLGNTVDIPYGYGFFASVFAGQMIRVTFGIWGGVALINVFLFAKGAQVVPTPPPDVPYDWGGYYW